MPLISSNDKIIYANTSGGPVTCQLPANPYIGEEHIIIDYSNNASVNNITINGNGNNINGSSTFIINLNIGYLKLNYNGVEWKIVGQLSESAKSIIVVDYDLTLLANHESVFVDLTAAAVEITLPASPVIGELHIIKDMYGNAATNNLTINGNGNDVETFNGTIEATSILSSDFDCVAYKFNGFHWSIV